MIVAAYLSANHLATAEIPGVIRTVYATLTSLSSTAPADVGPLKPAVPVKKSVTPDYIVCLEDGKKLKMLKRYLRSRYNLTPDEYRAKWSLPHDYPIVASDYAARRSALAKKFGLGRRPEKAGRRRKRA